MKGLPKTNEPPKSITAQPQTGGLGDQGLMDRLTSLEQGNW